MSVLCICGVAPLLHVRWGLKRFSDFSITLLSSHVGLQKSCEKKCSSNVFLFIVLENLLILSSNGTCHILMIVKCCVSESVCAQSRRVTEGEEPEIKLQFSEGQTQQLWDIQQLPALCYHMKQCGREHAVQSEKYN